LMAFARRDVGRDAFKSVVGRWGRFHAHALEEIGRTEEAIEEIQGALRLLSGRQARLGMLLNRLGREAEGKPVLNDLLTHMRREPKFVHKVQVDRHGREGIAGLSVVSVIPGAVPGIHVSAGMKEPRMVRYSGLPEFRKYSMPESSKPHFPVLNRP
jgi:hypothetical protein